MAKPKKPLILRWLVLLPIPVLWCVLGYLGLLDFIEQPSLDRRFKFRGELLAPVKVAYVDIDSRSITDIGNLTWDRAYYAEVCGALLNAGQARVIGIDQVFSKKGQPEVADVAKWRDGNRKLASFLFAQPPVVLAASYAAADDRDINGNPIVRTFPLVNEIKGAALPPELPEFPAGAAVWNPWYVGLIDTIKGEGREVHMFAQANSKTYYHMALELARLYWKLPPDGIKIHADRIELLQGDGAIKAMVPLIRNQDVEVNWFSKWISEKANPRASFSDALAYARMLNSSKGEEATAAKEFFKQFQDAVVLIGPVDPLLQDLAATPFDSIPVPRVGIHGNLLKTIVSGLYLRRPPMAVEILIVLMLTLAVSSLAVVEGRHGPWWKLLGGGLMLAYVAITFVVFSNQHLVLPMAMPLGAAFTTSFAGVIWQLVIEEKQKGRIKGLFGAYVSPQLVTRMVESGEEPKLGGVEAQVTAYFSDIEGFSIFAEKLSPAQLVELMNEYLTACTDIVTSQGGTLDKYIGDAVVAMFGAPVEFPDHAYRACVASQLVQQRLAELRKKWALEESRWPASVSQMHTRIGLNSGTAVVGNMGSLTRFNYTMMGDNVNLAARLESGARSYGAGTLVAEATKTAAELAGDRCVFRFLDRIVVKGRSKPVPIYEIMGLRDTISAEAKECAQLFGEGMTKYLQQDWDGAIVLFKKSALLEPRQIGEYVEINPSQLYLQRSEIMRMHPPGTDWDGVFVMKTK